MTMQVATYGLTLAQPASSSALTADMTKALVAKGSWQIDSNVQNCAQTLLDCGEYLSYAKYAQYVPGAPSILKHKAVSLVGDSCRIVNSGVKIKSRIDSILSNESSADLKTKQLIEVAQLAFGIANTQFVGYLPEAVGTSLKWANDLCGVATLGLNCKGKMDEVADCKEPGLAHTKDKIEATRLALWTADAALNMAGVSTFSPLKMTVSVGSGLLTAAKVGVSSVQWVGKAANAVFNRA